MSRGTGPSSLGGRDTTNRADNETPVSGNTSADIALVVLGSSSLRGGLSETVPDGAVAPHRPACTSAGITNAVPRNTPF